MDQYVIFCNLIGFFGRYALEHWTSGHGIAIDCEELGTYGTISAIREDIPNGYSVRDRLSSDAVNIIEVWVLDEKEEPSKTS